MSASTVTHHEMNSKPSKSAKKRETLALQSLGEQLIDLSAEQIQEMALGEALKDALIAAKTMRAHGALRRQKQLIGKLMRREDPAPIEAVLERYSRSENMEKNAFRLAEQWRERLTSDPKRSLNAFHATVGHENPALAVSVQEWSAAHDDKGRQLASRKIFREVHKDLRSLLQNQTNSL